MRQKLRKGVAVKLNLMPIDWYMKTATGRRLAKHVIEGTITDMETKEQITFTGAYRLLEIISDLQRKKAKQYRTGVLK